MPWTWEDTSPYVVGAVALSGTVPHALFAYTLRGVMQSINNCTKFLFCLAVAYLSIVHASLTFQSAVGALKLTGDWEAAKEHAQAVARGAIAGYGTVLDFMVVERFAVLYNFFGIGARGRNIANGLSLLASLAMAVSVGMMPESHARIGMECGPFAVAIISSLAITYRYHGATTPSHLTTFQFAWVGLTTHSVSIAALVSSVLLLASIFTRYVVHVSGIEHLLLVFASSSFSLLMIFKHKTLRRKLRQKKNTVNPVKNVSTAGSNEEHALAVINARYGTNFTAR